MHHASAPQQCFINSDSKMMASIDRSGTLTLTDVSEDKFGANVQSETIGQARGRAERRRVRSVTTSNERAAPTPPTPMDAVLETAAVTAPPAADPRRATLRSRTCFR